MAEMCLSCVMAAPKHAWPQSLRSMQPHSGLILWRSWMYHSSCACMCEGAPLLSQLAGRACACLHEFAPQHVSVLLWAYAKLDTSPGPGLLSGAAAAALAAMPRFNPQNMANTLWAYATLGHYPGTPLLDAAAQRQLVLMPVGPIRE